MRVRITKDEWYPCFEIDTDVIQGIDVPASLAASFKQIDFEFTQAQRSLRKLYEKQEATR